MAKPETPSTEANLKTLADPNRGRITIVALSEEYDWRLFSGMGGRSAGSKNRYYQRLEDLNGHEDYVRTAVHDPDLQKGDPSATLYIAQRCRGGWHVASNGEQTEGISVALAAVESFKVSSIDCFKEAQKLYRNEGPRNGYTARITAAVGHDTNFALMGKIVRDPDFLSDSSYHVYEIGPKSAFKIQPGEAYVIYTYDGKGGTDPDYEGPRKILLPGTLEESMDLIWNTWDANTKAGLVGKEIDRGSGRFKYAFRSIHPGRA